MGKKLNVQNRAVTSENDPLSDPIPPKAALVKVRAKGWMAEEINGKIERFAPGEVFELTAERRAAVGPLVDEV